MDPRHYGILPSKHTDRDVSTVMQTHTNRKIHLENESYTPYTVWYDCSHKVVRRGSNKGEIVYNFQNRISDTKMGFLRKFKIHPLLWEKLLHFDCVDQQNEGPCSLAALVSLLMLYQKKSTIPEIISCPNLKTLDKDFVRMYVTLGFDTDGYTNWLSFLNSAYTYTPALLSKLIFIPFRHRRAYNKMICPTEPQSADEYNVKLNAFMKRLLDSGYAFAVPFEGHFVVVAGYSDTGYLVINSFGKHVGFDGMWFVDPIVDPEYTQLNFCNGLTGIILLSEDAITSLPSAPLRPLPPSPPLCPEVSKLSKPKMRQVCKRLKQNDIDIGGCHYTHIAERLCEYYRSL